MENGQTLTKRPGPSIAARVSTLKEDPFYILATAPQPEQSTHVIKQGETFAVFNRYGDIGILQAEKPLSPTAFGNHQAAGKKFREM